MRGLLGTGLELAGTVLGITVMFILFSWDACASQPKIGLDLEWRPIEGLDEKPAAPPKAEGSSREQRKPETEPRTSGKAGEVKTFTVNGVTFKMIRIPAGEFLMGSPTSEPGRENDETQHRVRITKDYWLGETEVTQGLWKAVMGSNPSGFPSCGDDCPVEQVSWNDCQEVIRRLNSMVPGGRFRLPTEAEWEYGARAGTTGSYAGDLDSMAWYGNNSGSRVIDAEALWNADKSNYPKKILDNRCRTHPVAKKKPNTWGLYDMHGNVLEWCEDWYDDYPTGLVTDPTGPSSGSSRVDRGGSWSHGARYCRSAFRNWDVPGDRGRYLGLRLALP